MLLLPILNYHHVGVQAEPAGHRRLWVSTQRFSEHLEFLAREGYRSLTLRECLPFLREEAFLSGRAVVLSFDDGYSDFMDHAYPILQRYGFSATVAVVTGAVGTSSRWDPGWESPIMKWDDIVELNRRGIEIASHTVSHPRLSHLSRESMQHELGRSREMLEEKLGAPATSLVYPYGDSNSEVEETARGTGYHLACSSFRGNSHRPSDLFRLRRIPVDEFVTIPRLRQRLSPLYHYTCRVQQFGRQARKWLSRD